MAENTIWYKEEWATDLFADVAKSIFAPKPKEVAPASPQLGAKTVSEYPDWVIPVSILGAIGLILLFVFLKLH